MSKALSRVRALVSEIDLIQNQGRKSASTVPFMKPVPAEMVAPVFETPSQPANQPQSSQSVTPESPNVLPLHSRVEAPEGKVFIQLTGKIAVQLQLEHTEEIVEVRQIGETIEIRFTDGKAIHLPLKSVA